MNTKNQKLMEDLEEKIQLPIPIVQKNKYQVNSYMMGYHEYREIWIPKKREIFLAGMQPKKIVDKFDMLVKTTAFGHFPKRKARRFSTGLSMRVPCSMHFHV